MARDSAICTTASGHGARRSTDAVDCSRATSSDEFGAGTAPASGVQVIGACVSRNVNAVAAAAGGVRGTTVCVAKIGRSDPLHEEEVRTP
jgi:hypothetical protein